MVNEGPMRNTAGPVRCWWLSRACSCHSRWDLNVHFGNGCTSHGLLPDDLNVESDYRKNIEYHWTIEILRSPQTSEFLSAMALWKFCKKDVFLSMFFPEVQAAKAITSSSLKMQPPEDVWQCGYIDVTWESGEIGWNSGTWWLTILYSLWSFQPHQITSSNCLVLCPTNIHTNSPMSLVLLSNVNALHQGFCGVPFATRQPSYLSIKSLHSKEPQNTMELYSQADIGKLL